MALVSAAIVCGAYALSNENDAWLWLAVAGYVGHWFGDSLDGSLARYRKIERPTYGYFIDHSSDGLTTFMMLGGFGLSPYIRIDVALFAVVAYLLLSIHSFLLAKVSGDFPMSHGGMGPTEARILLIVLTIAMYFSTPGHSIIGQFSIFDIIFIALTGVLMVMFLTSTARAGRKLAARDKADRAARDD
jgi:archaetidylinositol phosphate synthase